MLSRRVIFWIFGLAACSAFTFIPGHYAGAIQGTGQQAGASNAVRPIGTIKAIAGNSITLTTDSGQNLTVLIQDSTRFVRLAPGQRDLKDATPIRLQDVQAGDRILVRGMASDDGKSVTASAVIAMKQADIAQKQQQELQDWQRRGVGGLVRSVNPAEGSVTISAASLSGTQNIVVRTSDKTVVRRYAPDSVKFDDAKVGTLADIKPGDQLRARGDRNGEGAELTADEIVSGSFRNIAGTVSSINAADKSLTVLDLATKKPVVVRITGDSQLHKLPPMMAQGIAARLKAPRGAGGSDASAPANQMQAGGANAPAGAPGGMRRPGGGGDIQQFLSRMPAITLADLQKGDAVMMVTTQGTPSAGVTAVTLLSGVEPILTASPPGSNAAMLLSPWSLGGGIPGAEAAQ